ncbi:unnamed protein product [Cyclocybe aegerita]|uniref:Uncharacterized protein n=1 Tax=Cyclocybe aegerita TaxID=1973307 RepID=A0A8S0WQ73_CYCAE|nr:unnamed protein product [Cyclocybe aegerita]
MPADTPTRIPGLRRLGIPTTMPSTGGTPRPTVVQIGDSIPESTYWHLSTVLRKTPHYENQYYLSLNGYLKTIFPEEQLYGVAPQHIIRPSLDADDIDEFQLAELSFTSTGGVHESRFQAGHERGKKIPDFTIIRVRPTSLNMYNKFFVCILEVKRDEVSKSHAIDQLLSYLLAMRDHSRHDPDAPGILLEGRKCSVWRLVDDEVFGTNIDVVDEFDVLDEIDAETGLDKLTALLADISCKHWDRADF